MLEVSWTYGDPKYFSRTYDAGPVTFAAALPDRPLEKYNCVPDVP